MHRSASRPANPGLGACVIFFATERRVRIVFVRVKVAPQLQSDSAHRRWTRMLEY
jgi:hypothetical protein